MNILTYLEQSCLRVGVEIPEQSECDCNPDREHYEVPIVIVGDSSQDIPWNLIRAMAYEHSRLRHRFILDLLLINGTHNRYLEVSLDCGKIDAKSISMESQVHDIIHQRATQLQHRFTANYNINSNVLTAAQKFAVTNGVALPQRKHDE